MIGCLGIITGRHIYRPEQAAEVVVDLVASDLGRED